MNAAKAVVHFLDDRIESILVVLLFTYFLVIISLEVVLRYIFNSSTIIGEETARHTFIWLSWIAASQAAKRRTHISISVIEKFLSQQGQYTMAFFYNSLFILLCILGFKYVSVFVGVHYKYNTLSIATRYPMYLVYAAVPLGYALMIVRVVQNMVIDYHDMRAGRPIRRGMALF